MLVHQSVDVGKSTSPADPMGHTLGFFPSDLWMKDFFIILSQLA